MHARSVIVHLHLDGRWRIDDKGHRIVATSRPRCFPADAMLSRARRLGATQAVGGLVAIGPHQFGILRLLGEQRVSARAPQQLDPSLAVQRGWDRRHCYTPDRGANRHAPVTTVRAEGISDNFSS
jgi:hypothetical protein